MGEYGCERRSRKSEITSYNSFCGGADNQFTRRRRWHRRAVCTEVVQKIPSEQAKADQTPPLKADPVVSTTPILSTTSTASETSGLTAHAEMGGKVTTLLDAGTARDDVLRQRLKKAMGSMGG